jgi:hypothetical protein
MRVVNSVNRSGSKDPMNVDVFKGAAGGIVKRATMGLIGEAGPEAVIPLSKARGLGHNITVTAPLTISGSAASDIVAAVRDHARLIAEEVGRVLENENMAAAAV